MVTKTDSSLIVHDGGTIKDALDKTKPIADYVALRAYAGSATQVRITSNGIAGFFYRDDTDTTSADNGGTFIVSTNGKRWKRDYFGAINAGWFGADYTGVTDSTIAIQTASLALVGGGTLYFPPGTYKYSRLTIRSGVVFQGAGSQCTFLVCIDSTTLDPGAALGSSIRKPDDGARVYRSGFRDLYISSGSAGTAANQEAYQNVVGINLCACERTVIENVSIGGFGQGAVVLARAEAGAEGLGFVNTTHDGNYNTITNISIGGCGAYNADTAAIWFKHKANSNKLYAVYAKGINGAYLVGIPHGNDNSVFGGSLETGRGVANLGSGVGATGNSFFGIRIEGVSGDGYVFGPTAENNTVVAGYHTGVTGQDFNLSANPNNRVISDTTNWLRNKTFPPASSYSTLHNLSALRVTSINGDPTDPLYIKSKDAGVVGSYPYVVLYNDISAGTAGNILGRLAWRNGDTTTGAAGISAAVEAVLEGSGGQTGLVFHTGTSGTALTENLRLTNNGVLRPGGDNIQTLGAAASRWSNAYAATFSPGAGSVKWTSGAGSPEAVLSAPVGSLYTRTDGAAGSTLYIKETGTGNTGWVAK